MNISATSSPYETLSLVIRALLAAVAGAGGRGVLGGALTCLIHARLQAVCGRMERLAARFAAGRVWRCGARAAVTAAARGPAVRVWPAGFGWLVRLMGYPAAGYGSQLRAVLETPEMVALLVAAPQAARILRPVCRMLAVEASVLRPKVAGAVVAVPAVAEVRPKRVRRPPEPVDWGRIPLPRGVLSAVRRRGFKTG